MILIFACATIGAALVTFFLAKQRRETIGASAVTATEPASQPAASNTEDWYLVNRAWFEGAPRDARVERIAIRVSLFLNNGGRIDARTVGIILGKPDFSRKFEDGTVSWGFSYPLERAHLRRWFIVEINANRQVTDHYFTDEDHTRDPANAAVHFWEQTFPNRSEWQRVWDRIVYLP